MYAHPNQSTPRLVAIFALLALVLSASWVAAADEENIVSGEIKRPGEYSSTGYTLGSKRIVENTQRGSESPAHAMVTPSASIDDVIPQPTWQAPRKVIDVRKEFPQARRTWQRVLWDPEVFRQGSGVSNAELGEFQADPHYVGRNSIPLREVEQINLDIPRAIEERERPRIDMIARTTGRGFMNLFFGWLEMPRNVANEMRKRDPVSGAAVGATKGAMWTILRTLNGGRELAQGAFDFVRLPFKRPEKLDHRIWIRPEWIASSVWGDPIPYLCEHDEFRGHSELTMAPELDY